LKKITSLVVIKNLVRPFKEPDAKGRARQAFFFCPEYDKREFAASISAVPK
jgi:hypothetical protein